MKITILGTATSQGIPVLACGCATCRSDDPKDKRLRTAAMVEIGERVLVIDVGPDFRQQMLGADVQNIDAVLVTHEHNDHVIGLDDLRPFNFKYDKNIPIYARSSVLEDFRLRFSYVFAANPYPGVPQIDLIPIVNNKSFEVCGVPVMPIETIHGRLPIYGFRIGDFCYITDVKYIEKSELEKINGSKILVLSALHHQEHHSHLSLTEALDLIQKLDVGDVYLTHLSHQMGPQKKLEKLLPAHVHVAYDGLVFELEN